MQSCQMCGCVHGVLRCDAVRCPRVACATPTIQPPGQCCPICTSKFLLCLLYSYVKPPHFNDPTVPPTLYIKTKRSSLVDSTTAVWNESHGCHLAGQYHAPGSSWHPYLVPDGYDLCAVCTCDFATRQVRCPRSRCPPLRCAEKDAYRPDKKACCRVCPEVIFMLIKDVNRPVSGDHTSARCK